MRQVTHDEIDAALATFAERRRKAAEAKQEERRRNLERLRKDVLAGNTTIPCGPCRPCLVSILSEVERDPDKCIGIRPPLGVRVR
jgi:hypothetical protein